MNTNKSFTDAKGVKVGNFKYTETFLLTKFILLGTFSVEVMRTICDVKSICKQGIAR